jgi:hypothetical protein
MSENSQDQAPVAAAQQNTEQTNLVRQRKMYESQLEQERQARLQLEQRLADIERSKHQHDDEDDDNEPYVDKKRLAKTTSKVKQEIKQESQVEIKNAIQQALEEDRRQRWLEANPDFEETMSHADKLAQMDPELARSILAMPETFERQKMVYRNIKLLGVHKPKAPESGIQAKIDANKRNPLQPFGVGAAPYGISNGGYTPSKSEGENAYKQMQALKDRLRLG